MSNGIEGAKTVGEMAATACMALNRDHLKIVQKLTGFLLELARRNGKLQRKLERSNAHRNELIKIRGRLIRGDIMGALEACNDGADPDGGMLADLQWAIQRLAEIQPAGTPDVSEAYKIAHRHSLTLATTMERPVEDLEDEGEYHPTIREALSAAMTEEELDKELEDLMARVFGGDR